MIETTTGDYVRFLRYRRRYRPRQIARIVGWPVAAVRGELARPRTVRGRDRL